MLPPPSFLPRRDVLRLTASTAAGLCVGDVFGADRLRSMPPPNPKKPAKKLAVVTTAYHYLSHAYHICGRFLYGYLRGETMHYPDFGIAGMFVDQQKDNDLSQELAKKHGFGLYPDVARALTLGGDTLAVDGVLLIGEHGDYPYNDKGQKLYPRYELFQKIVAVFQKSGRSVPVFNDKHLAYDRRKAKEMVDTARKVGFPLMAGSSLPVTWRRPEIEPALGTPFTEAVVASRGEIEIYGFHALEALQCLAERRKGGETGVKAVTCLTGDDVWKAGDAGVWSWELLEEALSRTPSLNVGDVRDNCRHYLPPPNRPTFPRGPVAFVIEYRDGFKGTALLLNGHIDDTVFAGRVAGEKRLVSTQFFLPPPPGAAFLQALAEKVEGFLATGKTPYPIERNLLTTGALDAVLEARVKKQRLETPELAIAYQAPADSGFMRGAYNRAP